MKTAWQKDTEDALTFVAQVSGSDFKKELSKTLGFVGIVDDSLLLRRAKNAQKNQTDMDNIREYLVTEYGGWNGDESGVGEDNAHTVEEILGLLDFLEGK